MSLLDIIAKEVMGSLGKDDSDDLDIKKLAKVLLSKANIDTEDRSKSAKEDDEDEEDSDSDEDEEDSDSDEDEEDSDSDEDEEDSDSDEDEEDSDSEEDEEDSDSDEDEEDSDSDEDEEDSDSDEDEEDSDSEEDEEDSDSDEDEEDSDSDEDDKVSSSSKASSDSSYLELIMKALNSSDFKKIAKSWVSNGENKEISPKELEKALGPELIESLAKDTGISKKALLKQLSAFLPSIVNKLTPDGKIGEGGLLGTGLKLLKGLLD